MIGHDVPFTPLHAICGLTEDRLRGLLDNLQAAEFLYATQHLSRPAIHLQALPHPRRHLQRGAPRTPPRHPRAGRGCHRTALCRPAWRTGRAARPSRHAGREAERRQCTISGRPEERRPRDRRCRTPGLGSSRLWRFSRRCRRAGPRWSRPSRFASSCGAVLRQLGEGRQMLDHLREAEALAERLKDDRRRGQVCAFMTTVQSTLDELDEALATGTRALEIAERLGDLRLRIRRHELSRAGVLLSGRIRARGRVRHRQSRGAARRLGPRIFRYGRAAHRSSAAPG